MNLNFSGKEDTTHLAQDFRSPNKLCVFLFLEDSFLNNLLFFLVYRIYLLLYVPNQCVDNDAAPPKIFGYSHNAYKEISPPLLEPIIKREVSVLFFDV